MLCVFACVYVRTGPQNAVGVCMYVCVHVCGFICVSEDRSSECFLCVCVCMCISEDRSSECLWCVCGYLHVCR